MQFKEGLSIVEKRFVKKSDWISDWYVDMAYFLAS